MAFRDINPAPMNPLAYASLAEAPAANFLAGQREAADMELVRRNVAREDATAAALAGYYQSPPDQRGAALNELAAIDPAKAGQVIDIQNAQAAQAAEQRRVQAVDEYARAQHVLSSKNPALALRLLDSDGTFLRQLEEQGIVDSADGISDEEARAIAQWAADTTAPLALSTERAEPADIRAMRELGFPMTPEGFAEYNKSKGTAADPTAAMLAQLQADERRARLEREQEEARRAAEEEKRAAAEREAARARQVSTVRRSLRQPGEIVKLAKDLQGTFLEAGVGGGDMRRKLSGFYAGAGAALGLDTSDAREMNDAYDKLKKNTADQLINLMSAGGLGEATNSKLQQYQDSLASTDTSIGAIMSIQANIAEMLLSEADAAGIEIENREAIEQQISELRGYATPAPEAAVDVPGAARAASDAVAGAVGQVVELANGVRLEFIKE